MIDKEFKIIIMGVDFGYQEKMMKMIKEFKIENFIQVIKNPTREEVIEAYDECEFLVLPSRWELSPLTPLEGFVFKKPVISTNVHGIPYTINDKKNCVLVESENYEQLGNAIIELFRDKNKIHIDTDNIKTNSLDELFYHYGSDKADIFKKTENKGHGYSKFYKQKLEKLRNQKINILEIGSYAGASAAAFVKYLPESNIFCFDVNISNFK